MISSGEIDVCAVVVGDAVGSMIIDEFLKRADEGCQHNNIPSPVIPNSYDRVARWQMDTFGLTREDLAAVSVFANKQGAKHPKSWFARLRSTCARALSRLMFKETVSQHDSGRCARVKANFSSDNALRMRQAV